jgi:hypothetical protein
MPPTEPEFDIHRLVDQMRMRANETQTMTIQRIKEYCPILVAYGVDTVKAEYDGEGDSGDMTVYVEQPRRPPIGNVVMSDEHRFAPTHDHIELRRFIEKAPKIAGVTFGDQQIDEFEDALFALLPSAWEINDGSFGEIVVKPAESTIYLQHNERYSEVNTSEYNW